MKRLLRFVHVLAACGVIGASAGQWSVRWAGERATGAAAPAAGDASLAATQQALEAMSRLVLWPSVVAMLLSGLLLIMARPAFFEARWVWVKALLLVALVPAAWVGQPAAALALAVLAVAVAMWRPRLGG